MYRPLGLREHLSSGAGVTAGSGGDCAPAEGADPEVLSRCPREASAPKGPAGDLSGGRLCLPGHFLLKRKGLQEMAGGTPSKATASCSFGFLKERKHVNILDARWTPLAAFIDS